MKACIDIRGTKVAVSLNTGAGLDLIARRSEPTAKTGASDALAQQVGEIFAHVAHHATSCATGRKPSK